MKTPYKNLVPGKTYNIELFDCCIEGDIQGTFWHWRIYDGKGGVEILAEPVFDEELAQHADAVFNIGTIGPGWGKWHPEEIKED